MKSLTQICTRLSQICFSWCLSPGTYYIMGNVVESLAFIPPDRPEAHEQMKVENKANLHTLKNSLGNDVAVLWFDFDAEYTILYSHGNAEDLAGSKATFVDLATYLECNLCAYDYSGYGLSSGQCSQKACFSDISRVFAFLTRERGIAAERIIVFGRSLGSGPSCFLAAQQTSLAGLVLQSPLRTAIKTQMPDWVGFVFKKIDIFANEDRAPHIRSFPVLIVHGTEDRVVPFSHGKHLFEALRKANHRRDRVQLYEVEGCGHNDIEYRKGRQFKRRLRAFVRTQIKRQHSATQTIASDADADADADELDADADADADEHKGDTDEEDADADTNYQAPHIKEISYEQKPVQ